MGEFGVGFVDLSYAGSHGRLLGQILMGIPRNCMHTAEPAVAFIQRHECCNAPTSRFMGWESYGNWGPECQRLQPKVHCEEKKTGLPASWSRALLHTPDLKNEGPEITLLTEISAKTRGKVPCNFPSAVKVKSPCFHLCQWGCKQREWMCTNSHKRVCIPACSWSTCWSSRAMAMHFSLNAQSCMGRNTQRASYTRSWNNKNGDWKVSRAQMKNSKWEKFLPKKSLQQNPSLQLEEQDFPSCKCQQKLNPPILS